jgi:hypothetical protein
VTDWQILENRIELRIYWPHTGRIVGLFIDLLVNRNRLSLLVETSAEAGPIQRGYTFYDAD